MASFGEYHWSGLALEPLKLKTSTARTCAIGELPFRPPAEVVLSHLQLRHHFVVHLTRMSAMDFF